MTLIRHHPLPVPPDVHPLGDLLARYLWIHSIEATWSAQERVIVSGFLKPHGDPGDTPALRRSFLDSLDAVLDLLHTVGIRHHRHPELTFTGEVWTGLDGADRFQRLQARIDLDLYTTSWTESP